MAVLVQSNARGVWEWAPLNKTDKKGLDYVVWYICKAKNYFIFFWTEKYIISRRVEFLANSTKVTSLIKSYLATEIHQCSSWYEQDVYGKSCLFITQIWWTKWQILPLVHIRYKFCFFIILWLGVLKDPIWIWIKTQMSNQMGQDSTTPELMRTQD